MKNSRKFTLGMLAVLAVFAGGAILGSCFPNKMIYTAIVIAAIVASILILYGYTGQTVKKRSQPKKKERPASSTRVEETTDGFADVYSGC